MRNVAFFCDFARGKAVLAKPQPPDGGNGKRNPAVRRRSVWTEEELRAAREADAGKDWADVPDDDEPESSSAGILSGGQEYQNWLREAGGLGGVQASGP